MIFTVNAVNTIIDMITITVVVIFITVTETTTITTITMIIVSTCYDRHYYYCYYHS